jgi:hypothetical protein
MGIFIILFWQSYLGDKILCFLTVNLVRQQFRSYHYVSHGVSIMFCVLFSCLFITRFKDNLKKLLKLDI